MDYFLEKSLARETDEKREVDFILHWVLP